MIPPMVFVIPEQEVVFEEDGVVANVRAPDRVEYFRPHVPMVLLITFDLGGLHTNHESEALHATVSPASRNRDAAASGVISRWGVPSISNPTMNFRTCAERSSGG